MKKLLTIAAASALALSGSALLNAQAKPPSRSSAAKTASSASADQTFVRKAAAGGMAEGELGKLATDKATNPQVKAFGQKMADDHGRANDELKTLAKNKNITLPSSLDAKDQALKDRLSKLSGDAFDKAYMQAMLKDHRADISEFNRESKSGKDPDVKSWAAKTLPTLESHMKLAQDDTKAVGTSGMKKSKTPKGR